MERARRALAVLCACVAVLLLGSLSAQARPRTASGGGPSVMAYTTIQRNVQSPIEQETDWPFPADHAEWVINPDGACAWDVDDHWVNMAQGSLRAGESLVATECTIASPTSYYRTVNGMTAWWSTSPGWYGVQVGADVGTLDVTVCYQPEGRCFTAAPAYDAPNKQWVYNSCSHAAFRTDDPALAVIPGSQGGIGVVQAVTTTVTNPTGRTARNITSLIGAVGAPFNAVGSGGCVKDAPISADYPFKYK